MAAERWLAVGLGNPEPQYAGTRHNVGAAAVRSLAAAEGASLARHRRAGGAACELRTGAARLVLFVPSSYMNASGGPVQAAARWYKVAVSHLVVCHDDLDLPLGAIRLKRGGGTAGHNGLKDVERALGTSQYLRVRIGIGRPPEPVPSRDHVLGRFTDGELELVDTVLGEVGAAIRTLLTDGLEAAQNRFHARG